jgi:FkbM family methyltransferase
VFISHALQQPLPQYDLRRPPIVWYGNGELTHLFFNELSLDNKFMITAILDRAAKEGQYFRGIPVVTPAQFAKNNDAASCVVVISLAHLRFDIAEIEDGLRNFGFSEVTNFAKFYLSAYEHISEPWYFLTDRENYRACGESLNRLDALLADTQSHMALEELMRLRLTGKYCSGSDDQYRPGDLHAWPNPMRFIDCGAFTGDTIKDLADNGYDFEAIAAFEPDRENFSILSRNSSHFQNMVCIPCALGRKTEIRYFADGLRLNSRLVNHAHEKQPVQCVSLDAVLPTFSPTLIKMDIEGGELDALAGAQDIIRKYRPSLAISVYHTPEHLWQIPFLLDDWNLEYRFFLRNHTQCGLETVLYAIPSDLKT